MKLPLTKTTLLVVLNILYIPISWSQESTAGTSLGSYSWEAVKVIISLAIVLTIFYLLVNVFKKYSGVSIKANSSIRVLGGLSLGGKEKVVILKAGNTNFLLGVSNAGISKLHQFDQGELDDNGHDQENPISFNHHIEKILGKKS